MTSADTSRNPNFFLPSSFHNILLSNTITRSKTVHQTKLFPVAAAAAVENLSKHFIDSSNSRQEQQQQQLQRQRYETAIQLKNAKEILSTRFAQQQQRSIEIKTLPQPPVGLIVPKSIEQMQNPIQTTRGPLGLATPLSLLNNSGAGCQSVPSSSPSSFFHFKCPLCLLEYRSQASLNEHMRKEHSVLI